MAFIPRLHSEQNLPSDVSHLSHFIQSTSQPKHGHQRKWLSSYSFFSSIQHTHFIQSPPLRIHNPNPKCLFSPEHLLQ